MCDGEISDVFKEETYDSLEYDMCVFGAALFEQGIRLDQHQASHMQTYESNILYSLRFMIDCNIKGGQWVSFPKQSYMVEKQKKLTHCQLELRAHYSRIVSHAPEGETPTSILLGLIETSAT